MQDKEVTQYFLRHTFATTCVQYVRPDIVDTWMGDSSERLVGRVYTHFPDKFMSNQMDVCSLNFNLIKQKLFGKISRRAFVIRDTASKVDAKMDAKNRGKWQKINLSAHKSIKYTKKSGIYAFILHNCPILVRSTGIEPVPNPKSSFIFKAFRRIVPEKSPK